MGGGKGALYAPPFPRHLTFPGFWDESYFADIRLTRLFTVLFTDSEGRPIRLRGEVEEWRPDRLILVHRSEEHVIRERRCLTESNAWVSEFVLESGSNLQAFVWSLPELREPGYGAPWQSLTKAKISPDSIGFEWQTAWPAELEPDRTGVEDERVNASQSQMGEPLPLFVEVGASAPRQSYTGSLAQRHDDSPLWETSLLPQKLRRGELPGDEKVFVGTPPTEGLVHLLQQYSLSAGEPLIVACGVGLSPEKAKAALAEALKNPFDRSEQDWRAYFASVPQFSSSDPFLTNAYWYRWYGLRLNTVDLEDLPICSNPGARFSPFVTEGVGFFRNFVTYSAQAHLREAAWMHSPRLALGILENLAKCQGEDGCFPGHNYSCRPARDFYHADFATGQLALQNIHRVESAEFMDALRKYLDYLFNVRGHEFDVPNGTFTTTWPESAYRPPMMILIFDQNETGQEYMSRYAFASETADRWESFRVCGVDATHYAERLSRRLMMVAKDKEEQRRFHGIHSQLLNGLAYMSFSPEDTFFCDVLPDGARSNARPATGLYPLDGNAYLLWHNDGLPLEKVFENWLASPAEFWLNRGFPATANSDPAFDTDAEWKGKRLNCSWSGRSWPMANSHLVDAAAEWARVQTKELESMRYEKVTLETRHKAGEALMKAITLMFHEGDPTRPNSYEHYDPITGTPSLYRGYDDYMHSWIVDLILRHAVGVQPGQDQINPLPLGVDWIECTDIPHPKGRMRVRIENDKVVNCLIA